MISQDLFLALWKINFLIKKFALDPEKKMNWLKKEVRFMKIISVIAQNVIFQNSSDF